MKKVEHLGIAVRDLAAAEKLFGTLFNTKPYKRETVESELVETSFFQVNHTKIELLEATDPDSVIARFIEKKGEGFHHIAFEVADIEAEIKRLQQEGFRIIDPIPKPGADNKMICFVHPKETNGVLIELCQERFK